MSCFVCCCSLGFQNTLEAPYDIEPSVESPPYSGHVYGVLFLVPLIKMKFTSVKPLKVTVLKEALGSYNLPFTPTKNRLLRNLVKLRPFRDKTKNKQKNPDAPKCLSLQLPKHLCNGEVSRKPL